MLGDDDVKTRFLESWSRGSGAAQSGLEKWSNLVKHVHGKKNRALSSVLDEIVFTYTFPRLDVNVSKGMNHLLKSPWCCHPKTGRVCVPIDAATADKFEPWTVPTLRTISEDMDKVTLGSNAAPGKEIYDTGLAPYVKCMDHFLARLGDAARAEKRCVRSIPTSRAALTSERRSVSSTARRARMCCTSRSVRPVACWRASRPRSGIVTPM